MTFREFWPYYLKEHADPRTRALHLIGTGLALALLVIGLVTAKWLWVVLALICGYGLSWIGHFCIEKKRPTAFESPLFSLYADLRMFALWCLGQLERHLIEAGVKEPDQ